jgi:hypothetical protein
MQERKPQTVAAGEMGILNQEWEIPRLCRGDSNSLTNPAVDDKEPLLAHVGWNAEQS